MKKIICYIIIYHSLVFAGETGKIIGIITDKENNPLFGVNIMIEGTILGSASNEIGNYSIHNIPASTYNINFSYIGYKTLTVKNVVINADLTKKLNVNMEVAAIEGDVVTVLAEKDIIVKDQTATTLTVVQEDINNMPVNSYVDVLTNMSGVIENNNGGGDNGIHIRGGRSGEIAYMVDGVMVEDALFGGMGSDISRGGISELSVIIGSFNAEYGEAMSGVINIVTREGNEFYDYNFRAISDQFGGYTNNWGSTRYEATIGGPLPLLNNFGSFLISGDKFSTKTRFQNTFLDRDISDQDGNIVSEDINFDGVEDQMKEGARMFFDTYKLESRLLTKLVLRPLDKLKITYSRNSLNTESRNFSSSYRLYPEYNSTNWLESNLSYLNLNYTINKDMYFNLRYSEFNNENWEGHPEFLNDEHELYSVIWEVPEDWDNTVIENIDGPDYVWLSNYAEPFDDRDSNGVFSFGDVFEDLNNDGKYSLGSGVNYYDGDAYGGISNYEFLIETPIYDLNGDSVGTRMPYYNSYENYYSKTKSYQGSLTWQLNPIHQIKMGFAFDLLLRSNQVN